MDWQAGQSGIDGLRDIVQQNSRAAASEVDLVRGASARVHDVQRMLLTRPPHGSRFARAPALLADTSTVDAALTGDPGDGPPAAPRSGGDRPPSAPRSGVARLREGPLADLFRSTDARPRES